MSLRIGTEIYSVLTATELPHGVGERVYPVLAPAGAVALPFVVYGVKAVSGEYTKDGGIGDTGSATVSCIASRYADAVDIAVEVRRRLESCPGIGRDTVLASSEDAYASDAAAYAVELTFTVRSDPDF